MLRNVDRQRSTDVAFDDHPLKMKRSIVDTDTTAYVNISSKDRIFEQKGLKPSCTANERSTSSVAGPWPYLHRRGAEPLAIDVRRFILHVGLA